MDTPKPPVPKPMARPRPPKTKRDPNLVKDLPKKGEARKKLITYDVKFKDGKEVEFRAPADVAVTDLGPLIYKKFKKWPVLIQKAPYTPSEHLMDRPFLHLKDMLKRGQA